MKTPSIADYALRTYDKLRYSDTDRQGHVNNAAFATFLETGRVEFLYDQEQPLWVPGTQFVIAKLEIDLRAELTWPGRVEIGTRIARIGNSSVALEQALFQGERCAATANTVIVLMNDETRKSHPLPPETRARLEELA